MPAGQVCSHLQRPEQPDPSKRQKSRSGAHSPSSAVSQAAWNDGVSLSLDKRQHASPSTPCKAPAQEAAPGTSQQAGAEAGGGQPYHSSTSKDSVRSGEYQSSHASRVPPHSTCAGGTWCQNGDGPTARQLLAKLRWATLGPPYDWTRREYAATDSAPPLPEYLRDLCIRLAAAASEATAACGQPVGEDADGGDVAGCSGCPEERAAVFQPNAALVNYYQREGDTLCGHQVWHAQNPESLTLLGPSCHETLNF